MEKGIQDERHYEISAVDLATWLDNQGEVLWNVDGDPFLGGRVRFPCAGDELAAFLRRLDRILLVQDCRPEPQGNGEVIDHTKLDDLATTFGGKSPKDVGEDEPLSAHDRLFYFTWKNSPRDWMLIEDLESTESERRDAIRFGSESSDP